MKRLIIIVSIVFALCSLNGWSQETGNNEAISSLLTKARELLMQGNRSEASEICLKIIQSNPDNKQAVQWWVMANMERVPGGEQKMEKKLDSLLQLFPGNTGILFFRTFIQAEFGKNEEALAGFEKLISLQPDSGINWLGKGQVLEAMGKNEESLSALENATSLGPNNADAWQIKAGLLAKMNKLDEAIDAYSKAIQITAHPIFLYNRGCAYSRKGDRNNAISDLKKAIQANPRLKQSALKDADFASLYEDEEFKAITK